MAATLNVYVKDRATGLGIGNARVVGLTKNQIVDPPVRQTSGDGGANLYYKGPGFNPPVDVSLLVDAIGYSPGSTNDQPIRFGVTDVNYTLFLDSFKPPFQAAPRVWKGNMGGIRVPGLPWVSGMENAPAGLFLSWFYDRYDATWRATLRAQMARQGYTHWLLSWPDARAHGASLPQFKALCEELMADGFYPCVMLCSKDFDDHDVTWILAGLQPVLDALVGVVPMFCVGWELSLWQNPTTCQQLIDGIAPRCLQQAGTLVYVHFQEGYPSFQQPGGTVADFWRLQVGKLTGLLYQKILAQNDAQFLDSLKDCLERFAGGFGMPTGFDIVALELTVMTQFSGATSEAEGDRVGRLAINAPKVNGVGMSGSGNGV